MSVRLSRRKIAQYVADQIHGGNSDIIEGLAALLIENRRTREADLIVRDIERELSVRGTLVAISHSAHKLSDKERGDVISYLKTERQATHVDLREVVEPSLLGGIRIDVPGAEIDTTIRRKLNELVSMKAEA